MIPSSNFFLVLPYSLFEEHKNSFTLCNVSYIGDFAVVSNFDFGVNIDMTSGKLRLHVEHSFYFMTSKLFLLASDFESLQVLLDEFNLPHAFGYNARVYDFDEALNFSVRTLNLEPVFLFDPNCDMELLLEKEIVVHFDVKIPEIERTEFVDTAKSKIRKYFSEYFENIADKPNLVLFSGGVDSSSIALMLGKMNLEPVLYSLRIDGKISKDLEYAKLVASHLGLMLNVVDVSSNEILEVVPQIMQIIHSIDVVKIEVGLVSYLILKSLVGKFSNVWTGLGAEELFAGYVRHLKNPFTEGVSGIYNIYWRDLERDFLIAKYCGMKPKLPFLYDPLVRFSLGIPSDLKVKDGMKKYIFRLVADEFGLGEFAYRKKLAAQYGSGVSKVLGELAKKNGFFYKKDFIRSIFESKVRKRF